MKSDDDSRFSTEEHLWHSSFNMAQEDITHMAMGVMALLRNDKKKALQQVKQLIKLKKEMACVVLTSDVGGWTPVHACVLRGHKKLLKTMLKAGISINCTMGQPEGLPARCTLLHVAANRTDKKILDYLLHHGADVNARDSDGNTALFYARLSNKDNARLLINCGATLDDSYHYKLHQNQTHLSVTKPTRQRHGSASSLKQENALHIPKSSTCHQLQHQTQHSQYNGQSSDNFFTSTSTVETTPSTKSQFLTVPPTKFFSSSPCLHLQGATNTGTAQSFINSSTSASNLRSPDQRSNKKFKNTPSIIINNNNNNNNNSTTVTDLNSKRGLKHASRSEYASSESILEKSGFQRAQNNSD